MTDTNVSNQNQVTHRVLAIAETTQTVMNNKFNEGHEIESLMENVWTFEKSGFIVLPLAAVKQVVESVDDRALKDDAVVVITQAIKEVESCVGS